MRIPSVISRAFGSATCARGEVYYHNGNIKRFSLTEDGRVNAVVRGGESYDVEVGILQNTLVVWCTCPYFEGGNFCKHIWAVLLRCYDHHSFPEASLRAVRDITVVPDGFEDDFFDNLTEFGEPYAEIDLQKNSASPKLRNQWQHLFSSARAESPVAVSVNEEKVFYHIRCGRHDPSLLTIDFYKRFRKADGEWSVPKALSFSYGSHPISDVDDQRIVSICMGATSIYSYFDGTASLNYAQAAIVVPLMASTGRLYLESEHYGVLGPIGFDGVQRTIRGGVFKTEKGDWRLSASIRHGEDIVSMAEIVELWQGGLIFTRSTAARFTPGKEVTAIIALMQSGPVSISAKKIGDFVNDYYTSTVRLPIDIPEEIRPREVSITPKPCLRLFQSSYNTPYQGPFGDVYFDYDGFEVAELRRYGSFYDRQSNRLIRIDEKFQQCAIDFLVNAGVTFAADYRRGVRVARIRKKELLPLVNTLLYEGWRVEGEKGVYKKPGRFSLSVNSGVDWFDLQATCSFDGEDVPLPLILAALKKNEHFVTLGSGSVGMLPEEWLRKYAPFARMGEISGDAVRFRKSQALLLDALLDERDSTVSLDAPFSRLRNELRNFEGIKQVAPGKSFQGTLRPYQKEGLGWIAFLEQFGFGGCLADDMGLGKTVQVLAQLDLRKQLQPKRKTKNSPGTSLVVAPRSLIFNWMEEANRFAPSLRVGDFSGLDRECSAQSFAGYDVVLITYGTLRRDIGTLKDVQFDYIVLDEAQIIKNSATITAKAARLLEGKHRLALSGTPVENCLGDLWSIFEFLNPGMLGTSSVFSAVGSATQPDDQTIELLRRVLKPFVLRRTKSQVASDLPPRTEETIICEMEGAQKKEYEWLKRYYQANLLGKVEKNGINRSKIIILEALLRLRQAACHPGLIDKDKRECTSVKLDTLLAKIEELHNEGHKCIVFSQFTQMLAIVRDRLNAAGKVHEYLDGKTIDRKSKVDRFQTDPSCFVFLISLKAGGLGLNLTAAEYVFILDPWWNPAAEAQAIDRTHRIGQTKPVFAYKLICKDTVEEKVLELQRRKRHLAESIISSDESILKGITVEDLKLLLG